MEQKIPVISDNDIKRVVKRDFPLLDFVEVECILQLYDAKVKENRNRVCAAILKLANGNIELLKDYTKAATLDYRDVLYWAEYPNYDHQASKEKRAQQNSENWLLYQSWLNKVE